MTVKTQVNKITGLGNDSAFTYPFSPMVVYAPSDLTVTHVDADGVETLLVRGTGATNYSIDVATYPGTGSITYPADEGTPIPLGESVVMKPVFTIEQQTSLSTQGGYNPKTLETQLDKGIRIDLQQQEQIDRTLKLPVSSSGVDPELEDAEALKHIRWNAAGTGLENVAPGSATLQIPADGSVTPAKFSTPVVLAVETVADLIALTDPTEGLIYQTEGYTTSGDRGANTYLATTAAIGDEDGGHIIDSTGKPGIKFKGLFLNGIAGNQWGYIDDDSTDNATAITNAFLYMRSIGGGRIDFYGDGIAQTTYPMIPGSNTEIVVWGTLNPTGIESSWSSHGVLFGQVNREDIGRSAGVEETANLGGTLAVGDIDITMTGRWNETAGDWSNSVTWSPEVGQLCVVCRTDDVGADPTRPVPSFTHMRRVTAISGSTITIDRSVAGAGEYMVIPASDDLGYDRTAYGGLGRVEIIENTTFRGKVDSDNGFPMLTGGIIDCYISGGFKGRAIIYGNGARESTFDCHGVFTRNAAELALGSEDFYIKKLIGQHVDTGQSYTVACIQFGERCRGGHLGRIRVDAPDWDGNDSLSVLGVGFTIDDLYMDTGCTLRLVVIGSSASDADFFISHRMDVGSSGSMTGRLLETNSTEDIRLRARLRGSTSNADATHVQGSGAVEDLEVVDDGGIVRLNEDYLIGDVRCSGAIASTGSWVMRDRIKPKRRSQYLTTETYAATFAPDEDFQMVLTGNCTLNDPTGTYENGDRIQATFIQDGVASHSVSFGGGSLYRGIAAPGSSATASDRWTADFMWTGAIWVCIAHNGGWA